MSKSVLFQTIQFCISAEFTSICPIDTTLGDTTPGQSVPGSDDNKGVLHIPPKHKHYENLTIRLLGVLSGHSLWGLTPLQKCSGVRPQTTGQKS